MILPTGDEIGEEEGWFITLYEGEGEEEGDEEKVD